MVDELLAPEVVFAIADGMGTRVLPSGKGSTFAMLVLCSKRATTSTIERIFLADRFVEHYP